jgi:hypothetical protein
MSDLNDPSYVAIRDFVITEAAHQQTKEAYTAARKTLLNLLPKQIGEHTLAAGGFTLSINYPEKNVWDAEQLNALYGSDKPAHVKLAYSIDMNVLKRLPLPQQQELAQCYEVKAGTPVIDIVKA